MQFSLHRANLFIGICLLLLAIRVDAQSDSAQSMPAFWSDTIGAGTADSSSESDSILPIEPLNSALAETDTTPLAPSDSTDIDGEIPNFISSRIEYHAEDSIRMNKTKEISYLFGNASIAYGDISLKADYIEINWNTKLLYAKGSLDSTGNLKGNPIFDEGGKVFDAREMYYNIETEKGRIIDVTTKEGEGFLRGDQVKQIDEGILFVQDGYFTTDDRVPPDYFIQANRIKLIADDKIITGPAYMVVADVPTPLVLPFGLFPAQDKRASGIVIPTYGENGNRGFFLRGMGYYWAVNDYMDLRFTADVYSRGGWATYLQSSYNKRYRHSGQLALSYNVIKIGDIELPGYFESRDFNVRWSHRQSPVARPNSQFSATVNAGSGSYFQNNTTNPGDFLKNQLNSTINWSYNHPTQPIALSLNFAHNQNIATRSLDLTLPDMAVNVQRFYPLERRYATGGKKWYEKIGVQYSMNFKNQINTYDSLFLQPGFTDDFRAGVQHKIPIQTNFKVLKYFSMSPQFNYSERWYFNRVEKQFSGVDDAVITDTINTFFANRDFNFRTNLTTKLYGFYNFKRGNVKAIRHVATPSVAFNYRPDFSRDFWGFYGTYIDSTSGEDVLYSYSENGIYGSPPTGRSGSISFDLINNLDMKRMVETDTGVREEKLALFESFQLGTSYNLASDEFALAPLRFNGRTRLFKNLLSIRMDGLYDFYALDTAGRRVNEFIWENSSRWARLTKISLAVGIQLNPERLRGTTAENDPTESTEPLDFSDRSHVYRQYPYARYADFSTPWTLSADFNLRYSKPGLEATFTQAMSMRGDLSLTPHWKIGATSGYDFKNKEITYTTLDLYRDLHSWEMRLTWIPLGFQKSYNFYIAIKAPILKDVKIQRRRGLGDFNQF